MLPIANGGRVVHVFETKAPYRTGRLREELGVLEVVDEGPGIASEMLPRRFERFARGEGSGGLGLGLYLARRIAAAHRGNLGVESALGKGARFILELPIDDVR